MNLPTGALNPGGIGTKRLPLHRPAALPDVTAFLITTGEATTEAARAALDAQTVRVQVETIDHVAPMNTAFQAMLDRCTTPYYVQVDADMLLHADAVWSLYEGITRHFPEPQVWMVCAPLWDDFDERPIYGVKIYRHAICARYPYRQSRSCETDQIERLKADGFYYRTPPLMVRDHCFGLHGTYYTPREAFTRYRGLAQKQRRSKALHPPHGELAWIEGIRGKHLAKWRETGDMAHLAAEFGLVAGNTGPLPPEREDDYRATDEDLERVNAWWFDPAPLPKWVMEWR